jgi:hypothetical protein
MTVGWLVLEARLRRLSGKMDETACSVALRGERAGRELEQRRPAWACLHERNPNVSNAYEHESLCACIRV